MTHLGIPWPIFRAAIRLFRRLFATVEPPDQSHLRTDATIGQLREIFGRAHFTNGWELSYHYAGEDLNMRRPDYHDGDYRWRQTHVRGFNQGNHRTLYAHYELEPTAYPELHLHNVNLDVGEGLERVANVLDDAGIAYELVA